MLYDCVDKPKKGIDGGRAVAINWSDIDLTATTFDGAKITDLVLKAGATGYPVEWFKDLASANSAFVPSTEDLEGFTHSFLTRIQNASVGGAERALELSKGTFVYVCETKYKGTNNAEAFKVFGIENGLKLAELTYDTLANSGSMLYTVTTEEGSTETYPFNVFLEGDYETSKATFETLFAEV